MRVARVDSQDPAQSRAYAYGLKGQLLTEFAGGGGAPHWNRDVIYLGGRAIAEIDGRGVHELHWDHLGTPRLITSGSTGLAEGTQTFGPYGERLASSGYLPLTGYTGHLQEEPNGLIYMKGRFYSPAWHRFLNSDQGVDPQSLNQYAYCGGNPMVCVDPIGLGLLGDLWGGILSLFGAGGGEEGKGKGGGGSLPPLDGFGKFGGGGGGGDGRHRQEPSVDWGALITRNAQGGDLLTIGDYEVSTDEKGGIGWFLPLSLQPGAIVDISENGEAQIDQTGQKPSFGDYFERRWSAPRVYA
jgi:RHS repeat-associated protein